MRSYFYWFLLFVSSHGIKNKRRSHAWTVHRPRYDYFCDQKEVCFVSSSFSSGWCSELPNLKHTMTELRDKYYCSSTSSRIKTKETWKSLLYVSIIVESSILEILFLQRTNSTWQCSYLLLLRVFVSTLWDIIAIKSTTRNPDTAASPVKTSCIEFTSAAETENTERTQSFKKNWSIIIYNDFWGFVLMLKIFKGPQCSCPERTLPLTQCQLGLDPATPRSS